MYLDDLYINMEFKIFETVIDSERMLAFGQMYDPIPLHCDEKYAKTKKFGRLIAPEAMSFMKVWTKFMECGILGEELVAGSSTKIEWFKPFFANDVLHEKARISNIIR